MSSDFAPSQAEVALTNKIFDKCDPQKLGIITGDTAVVVFTSAKLPPAVLGEVWTIADKENNGFLTRKGVSIALRLLGHAQRGEQVSEALVSKREYTRFASPFQPIWQGFTLIQPDCHQTLRVIRYQFSSSTLEVRSAGLNRLRHRSHQFHY
jgi:hypothetical protein